MRNFFERLMYGRYGMDKLNNLLLWGYLLTILLYWALRWRIFYWGSTLLFVLFFVRMMSRNTWQRQKENERFLSILHSIRTSWHFRLRRIKEWRQYRYRTCPHCQSTLRLPRKRGTHTVCCPRCHQDFSVTIHF
ncbi:MAG: hypothetical protein Q4F79_08455 [Eubacteriales bacterium]|nr:hypothetical protein [Eubacteriales bacterium]